MTVREMVKQIQREVRDAADLQPDRAADLLTKLTALLGNISDEIRIADAGPIPAPRGVERGACEHLNVRLQLRIPAMSFDVTANTVATLGELLRGNALDATAILHHDETVQGHPA